MSEHTDHISGIREALRDEQRDMAREAVRDADTLIEIRDVVVEANVELTDQYILLAGILVGLEMAKEEVEDEFDRNLEDYKNPRRLLREEGLVEERQHAAQEAARIMRRIDSEKGDELVEELREAEE